MSARRRWSILAVGALALTLPLALVGPVAADGGHGRGTMGGVAARKAPVTRVNPALGPDYEMPFVCGQAWKGTTRPAHSPSRWTIDFNAPNDLGKPALASARGVVSKVVSLKRSYGKYVVVDHGAGHTTLYAHLHQITATVGTVVDQGDQLGYVGRSGNVTGPHLHFEQRKDGRFFTPYSHRAPFRFGSTNSSGNCSDRPISGDWDGDGKTDVGVFRPTPGLAEMRLLTAAGTTAYAFGLPGDAPLTGDFDGDGTTQVAVRRRGTGDTYLRAADGSVQRLTGIGTAGDTQITGDWDGDGFSDVGFHRASSRTFHLRDSDGVWTVLGWGGSGEQPVTGDWDGDGTTDLGSYHPLTAQWTLRVPTPTGVTTQVHTFGSPGDLPVTGDWNGDGTTDLGVWNPATATFTLRTPDSAVPARLITRTVVFGNRR